MLSGDRDHHRKQRDEVTRKVYTPSDWAQQVREYYYKTTYHLIKNNSDELKEDIYQLDVVKE